MDAKLKAEWVKALRSGEYTQTIDVLRDSNGHCCLGVLCDVALRVGSLDRDLIDVRHDAPLPAIRPSAELSHEVRAALGITQEQVRRLVARNDGTGEFLGNRQSFRAIADFIEAEVE